MKKKIVLPLEEWNKLQSIENTEEIVLTVLNAAYGPFYHFGPDDIRVVENTFDHIVVWWVGIDDHDCFVYISFDDATTVTNASVLIDVYRWDDATTTIEYDGTQENE